MYVSPTASYQLKQDDSYTLSLLQPLEASLSNRNDLYRLAITLEPDSARIFVPKEIYNYRQNEDQRRSLLDLLRGNVVQLMALLAEITPADETPKEIKNGPNYGSIWDLSEMEISSKTGWEAEVIRLQTRVLEIQKRRKDDGGIAAERQAKENADKKAKATKMIRYFQDAIKQLEQIGAKTWNEIFPEEPSKWRVDQGTQNQLFSEQPAQAGTVDAPTRRYSLFQPYGVAPAGAHLTPLYDELFEAIWAGDTEKVKEMCLPPTEGCKPTQEDHLQITAGVTFRDLPSTSTDIRKSWVSLLPALAVSLS